MEVGVCSGKWKISLVVGALSAFAHTWVGAAPPGILWDFSFIFPFFSRFAVQCQEVPLWLC